MKDIIKYRSTMVSLTLAMALFLTGGVSAQQFTRNNNRNISLKISFGHTHPNRSTKWVKLIDGSAGLLINQVNGQQFEGGDQVGSEFLFDCGAGDVDELIANISWPAPAASLRKRAQHQDDYSTHGGGMWGYLLEKGAPGQVKRLSADIWNKPDAPIFTIQLNKEGTEGFSVGLEQLLKHGAMWLPEQDVFLSLADQPIDFKKHIAGLKGERILDLVSKSTDASLEQFKKKWIDFGNPLQWNASWQTKHMGTTGHLTVTAAAHGSIYKYAIDRWGNVRPDFASPHKFRLDFQWAGSRWKQQKILNGLPVILTQLKRNEQSCQMEQFAAPLAGLSGHHTGNIKTVLLSKLKFSGKEGPIQFSISLNNEAKNSQLELIKIRNHWAVVDKQTRHIWLMLDTGREISVKLEEVVAHADGQRLLISLTGSLRKGAVNELVVKLPSPAVAPANASKIVDLNYLAARKSVINYWQNWINRGAYFEVPEKEVNALFKASLWHALILPRHQVDENGSPRMDLPYANTAYGQKNADWPVNQAVYVDYMIYGLRGYEKVAADELASMFNTQQQKDGRIAGYANWGVYSPAHLYTVAQNYLLSQNAVEFKKLLPNAMKTLDWCLDQVRKANLGDRKTGLILAPLNDLTKEEREWAFTQAYFVAGLELFGRALSKYGDPRAEEVQVMASHMKNNVAREFARSSVKSPIVQLEDGTWINYVPTDAMTPRRMMEQWYPTDVDCGPLHLSRLGVLDPHSWLTTAMLHDHEDNLFLKNLGAANEPVYVQQGNAYLLRDDPKSAIRSFYSLMACGFSHGQLTSLEHRWAWGQYYGPPSTDGAWFELYRKMLVNEIENDTLIIGQAIPRKWLENGKQIIVKKAPTYFGPLSFTIESQAAKNEISAVVNLSDHNVPQKLLVRFRHPDGKPIQSVSINGVSWSDFNKEKEHIIINKPAGLNYQITARY
ncbi:hypothetical protein [Pedobacter immunditicola]|uniref:hypothetical protein n=1 Tax=Pedobacter immunditicola TaxID=3133440 RepID=UPI0030A5C43E